MLERFRALVLSTSESRNIAQVVREALGGTCSCTVWDDDSVFTLSKTAIEALEHAATRYDCVVVIATAHDVVTMRKQIFRQVRDNIIFEIGLFSGSLGRENVYVIFDSAVWQDTRVPSDLLGVTFATFNSKDIKDDNSNIRSVLTESIRRIKSNIVASAAFAAAQVKRVSIIGGSSENVSTDAHIRTFMLDLLKQFERRDLGINSCGPKPILFAAYDFVRLRMGG